MGDPQTAFSATREALKASKGKHRTRVPRPDLNGSTCTVRFYVEGGLVKILGLPADPRSKRR